MRPRSLLTAAFGGLLLGLVGCAVPTPYQPVSEGGYGYAEQQLESNRYRVSFAGNSVTSRDVVQNYLVYRAAELTLANHHDYFTVVDQNLERSTVYHGTGGSAFGVFPQRNTARGLVGFGPSSYSAYPIDSYTAYADILMGDGAKPADDVNSYDARDVLRQLGPTVAGVKE